VYNQSYGLERISKIESCHVDSSSYDRNVDYVWKNRSYRSASRHHNLVSDRYYLSTNAFTVSFPFKPTVAVSVLALQMDVQCDELTTIVGRLLTALATVDVPYHNYALSPEFATKF